MRGGSAATLLGRFLRWWLAELAGMLPPALRRGGPRILLDLRGEGPALLRRTRGGWTQAALDGGMALPGALRRALDAEPRLVLLVPPGWMLLRRLRLPEAAEARLEAVLGFEVEQHVPFAAAEVVWSARLAGRLPEQRRIEVETAVLPRHLLAPATQALRRAGLKAGILATTQTDAAWPAVPLDALAPPRRRLRSWLEGALAACALLLAAGIALGGLRREEQAAAAIEARAGAAREAAERVMRLEEQVAALRARLDLAREMRAGRPPAGAVLEEMARLLPDEAWLTEFRLVGRQVTVSGFALRADGLIRLLDASPLFTEVRFAAPVTRDRPDAAERFQIALQVAPPVVRTAAR